MDKEFERRVSQLLPRNNNNRIQIARRPEFLVVLLWPVSPDVYTINLKLRKMISFAQLFTASGDRNEIV
jgi:hypothetical protein